MNQHTSPAYPQKNPAAVAAGFSTAPKKGSSSAVDDVIDIDYAEDLSLVQRASETTPVIIELRSNCEVPSPTAGQFLALYFRLTDELSYRACFNELGRPLSPNNAWVNSTAFKTISFMSNYEVVFDRIYRLCVKDELLEKIRMLYDSKVVAEHEITEDDIHGITINITSLEQAQIFLDGVTSRVFASNFGYILNQYGKSDIQKIFAATNLSGADKSTLEQKIVSIIDDEILEQADEIDDSDEYMENGIYAENEKYILLHVLKHLGDSGVFSVSLQQLGLTVLSTHLMGLESESPDVDSIGLPAYNSFALDDELMRKSLINSSVLAHRQHYPSKALSTLF